MKDSSSDRDMLSVSSEGPLAESSRATKAPFSSRVVGAYQFLCGMVLAWFWFRSGLAHITNSYFFLSSVYSYEIVGPSFGLFAAIILPSLQLTLAVSLIIRRFVGGALLLSSVLLTIFALAQVWAFIGGMNIGCGCFGAADHNPIGSESLTMTSSLWACAVSAFLCSLIGSRELKQGEGISMQLGHSC